ncbi:hypothetical protein DOY81_002604 [Sarcophaga bullata]|nr:hypothetical protein DOY81_002604 [Sarcophaga bullata]
MKKKNTKQSAMIWTPPSPNLPDIKNNQKENNYNLPNETKPSSKQITEKILYKQNNCYNSNQNFLLICNKTQNTF